MCHGVARTDEKTSLSLPLCLVVKLHTGKQIPCICNVTHFTYFPPVSVWNGPLTSTMSSSIKELNLSVWLPPSLGIPITEFNKCFQIHMHKIFVALRWEILSPVHLGQTKDKIFTWNGGDMPPLSFQNHIFVHSILTMIITCLYPSKQICLNSG